MFVCLYVDLLGSFHREDAYSDVLFPLSNGTAITLQAYFRPRGFQQVEDHRFQDYRHIKMIRLSALRASRL